MTRTVYLLRYYDWDCECGYTIGLFRTLTDVHAYLIAEWEGRFRDADVVEPKPREYSIGTYPMTTIEIDGGEYGNEIEIEKLTVDLLKQEATE